MKKDNKAMGLLAYLSLIISALISLTLVILSWVDKTVDLSGFQFVANLFLIIVVVWLAWQYAKTLKKFGKVVFLIVALLAILSAIGVSFF
ncbi:MAG: hypothetical protein RBS76_03075 [Acholeplasmatales bacterium]|jgi:hypothetical protein|nr:hypothetical protein [Acholeplasmataceae bacterium]MDY0115465.1 hypothetical protein [Acholeplasmatales bacterium]MCK9234137.1 hypothetical protein [Acholeplasmataceae bacterium]MCK9288892.1 hypothetical protein [Acholeplasmataceae bacterium]MCK9427486.1 hypothetical protein [Acholeplasmataceae bacterium]